MSKLGAVPVDAARSRWQWLAAGLAGAPALVTLIALLVTLLFGSFSLEQLTRGALTVPVLAVTLAGAWLAAQRDGPRAPLGLATVATLAAVVSLPRALEAVVVAGPLSSRLFPDMVVPLGLAGATLAAALLALHARGERYRLGRARLRRAVAGAMALWALASAGAPLAGQSLAPSHAQSLATQAWVAHLLTPLVVLAIAAVAWHRDSLTVVPAALVTTVDALWSAATHALSLTMDLAPYPLAPSLVVATQPGVAFEAFAAVVLTVATVRLTVVTPGPA